MARRLSNDSPQDSFDPSLNPIKTLDHQDIPSGYPAHVPPHTALFIFWKTWDTDTPTDQRLPIILEQILQGDRELLLSKCQAFQRHIDAQLGKKYCAEGELG